MLKYFIVFIVVSFVVYVGYCLLSDNQKEVDDWLRWEGSEDEQRWARDRFNKGNK